MTDPGSTAPDPPTAAATAAAQTPPTTQDLATGYDPATGRAPATAAPHRRRRWAVLLLAAVVVLGLAAGLVVWAPWTPPPVLRPTGLVAGPATANSVAFHWSRPPTGPPPDRYLILGSGTAAGSVAGTVTSYRQTGLTPATAYQYRVVAVRGGKRSPRSARLTVRTLTPPISQARLQGSWSIYAKATKIIGPPPPGRRDGYMTWQLTPACAAGACDLILHGKNGPSSFKGKLTLAGAAYTGRAVTHFRCGPRANWVPYPVTLKFRIHPTKATGKNRVWAATSFAGTMVMSFHYVSTASFYCPTFTAKGPITGTPA